ncbi:MAG: hypothetical protein HYY09_05300 [Firmicutes bacterium]|nr:hypothetical protein [Bacillota bacterium]
MAGPQPGAGVEVLARLAAVAGELRRILAGEDPLIMEREIETLAVRLEDLKMTAIGTGWGTLPESGEAEDSDRETEDDGIIDTLTAANAANHWLVSRGLSRSRTLRSFLAPFMSPGYSHPGVAESASDFGPVRNRFSAVGAARVNRLA